ncbi:hypothetical protein C2R22_13545 [Salinigranum rubrum]|uniref:DUF58 domain-containing protein n=2 Tax=Salinigranum rubrum TaxID=755307 RepID=A0A2I8VKT2_9EURY|nr:hypothetical protein C2R22_13545 [Salinigranum rubrum]
MRVNRRPVEIGAVGVVLAVCGVVFTQPLLLFGAAGVGGWLIGHQRAFVSAVRATDRSLSVSIHPAEQRTTVGREVPVAVTVELDEPAPLPLRIEPQTPVAATISDYVPATLDAGETSTEFTYTVEFHVAGTHELRPLELTLTDTDGSFSETVERGSPVELVVNASGPTGIHVGQGAEDVANWYGDEDKQLAERGLDPQDIRAYVPGDVMKNIDWNVTARTGDLHVRQYGQESDRHAVVIIDQRPAMNVGPEGETKFAYAREFALALVGSADAAFDSLAIYGVDEEGIVSRTQSAVTGGGATSLHEALLRMTPQSTGERNTATRRYASPVGRQRVAGRLGSGDSSFEERLRPFFRLQHRELVSGEKNPIQLAIQREQAMVDDRLSVLIVTDDSDPRRVWDSVQFGTRVADDVSVFLTPHVLFAPDGLADLEAAYEAYRTFEEFRTELDRMRGVRAFEVAPSDRLRTVVESRRTQSQ